MTGDKKLFILVHIQGRLIDMKENLILAVLFAASVLFFLSKIGEAIDKEFQFTDERVQIHLRETAE